MGMKRRNFMGFAGVAGILDGIAAGTEAKANRRLLCRGDGLHPGVFF